MKALFQHFAAHPWRVPLYALLAALVCGFGQFYVFVLSLNYEISKPLAVSLCLVGGVVLTVLLVGYVKAFRALNRDENKRGQVAPMVFLAILHLLGTTFFWLVSILIALGE